MKSDRHFPSFRARVARVAGLAAWPLLTILLAACSSVLAPADGPKRVAARMTPPSTPVPVAPSVAPTPPRPAPPPGSDPAETPDPDAMAEPPPFLAPAASTPAQPLDAVPRVERIPQRAPNLPYVVRGDAYEPESKDVPMVETGLASWYGEPFHGRRTANGEIYDMDSMTAAHRTMPLPSYAVVRNKRNGRQIIVRVNDRGPYKYEGRVIDLSRAAARKLGFTGLAQVEVRRLTHHEIRTGAWKRAVRRLALAEQAR